MRDRRLTLRTRSMPPEPAVPEGRPPPGRLRVLRRRAPSHRPRVSGVSRRPPRTPSPCQPYRAARSRDPAKHLPAPLFFERPRGAAGEADRARGWGSPRRTRPRSPRRRGRQKPCSGLMGPNALSCGVWVTPRKPGVSPRHRREPGRRYDLGLRRRETWRERTAPHKGRGE